MKTTKLQGEAAGFLSRVKKSWKRAVSLAMVGAMLIGSSITVEAATVKDIFDASYYSETYADLAAAYGTNAKALYKHYTTFGQKEGRVCSQLIDLKKYREAYADLDKAFGDDWNAYLNHYLTFGAKEGRNSFGQFDAVAYADRYPDLKAAYGYDVLALYKHYLAFGKAEGRDASGVNSYAGGSYSDDDDDDDDDNDNSGSSDSNDDYTGGAIETVQGGIVDPETGAPVPTAVITFTRVSGVFDEMASVSGNSVSGNNASSVVVGDGVYTVYVAADGTYDVSNFEPGVYSVSVTAEGYMPLSLQAITISSEASTVTIPTFELLSADRSGSNPVRGQITDASTGSVIGGVTVKVRADWNNRTGDVIASVVADANGEYSLELERGYYTLEFVTDGYASEFVNVATSNQTPTRDGHLSAVADVNSTQYRIVLTWGETPRDLDSHLVGPSATNSLGYFHVYFGDKDYSEGNSFVASLDIDDVTSYGPETVTIINAADDKTYYYSVHDFTNGYSQTSTQMANSGATVKVYRGSTLVKEYSISNRSQGTIWNVFKIENGRIVDINTYSSTYNTMYGEYVNQQ